MVEIQLARNPENQATVGELKEGSLMFRTERKQRLTECTEQSCGFHSFRAATKNAPDTNTILVQGTARVKLSVSV